MPREDRIRSLSEINSLFKAVGPLDATIARLLDTRSRLDVLEIGFGYGRVLLELAWMFRHRNVTFHGVDVARYVETREDLRKVATQFAIGPESELNAFELPRIYWYDATSLHFDDESADFVYSAVTIRFIRRKAEFLEEVCRVLRPGGSAVLHMSESNWDYPYSLAADRRILTPYVNRFVLRFGDELIPLPVYLKLFEDGHFRFQFTTSSRCILCVSKRMSGRLTLNLDFNEELSISGRKLPLKNRHGEVRGGFRSVYDVRPEYYRALFEKRLLSRDDLRTDVVLSSEAEPLL
jgi:ubiquinone/menaquinone biosynthesis C-methylase UbiE